MQGGSEQQVPPKATVIMFGRPDASYVPTTSTGVENKIVLALSDFFFIVSSS